MINKARKDWKIIFAGGTDWSTEFLKKLLENKFNVIGVIGPQDTQKNRGQKISSPFIISEAKKFGLKTWQPEKLNSEDFISEVNETKPDLIIIVAYGKLLPEVLLNLPTKDCINVHPSLLPELRGPSPIQYAILEGLKKTGVTIFKLDTGMDNGPIIGQKEIELNNQETASELTEKLIELGKNLLIEILDGYLKGEIIPSPQADNKATYCKIIKKEEGKINWNQESAEVIDRKIRAFEGWAKTFTFVEINGQKKRVNILESEGVAETTDLEAHCNMSLHKSGQFTRYQTNSEIFLIAKAKENFILISKLQMEGKNPISANDFLMGYKTSSFID